MPTPALAAIPSRERAAEAEARKNIGQFGRPAGAKADGHRKRPIRPQAVWLDHAGHQTLKDQRVIGFAAVNVRGPTATC